jgi:hypothetical protein
MKLIPILIIMMLIASPFVAMAQEPPTTPIPPTMPPIPTMSWQVEPSRSIIWIGEELIIHVNGTANTTYTLEMRPLGVNNTLSNATFTDYRTTGMNGTDWAVVPDDSNEEAGNYRVQVLVNQMFVGYADVRLDYSFERWTEIQIKKLNQRLEWQNATNQEGLQRDNAIVKWLNSLDWKFSFILILDIIIVASLIPIWLGAYKSNCETKNKRSRFIEILEGVEEDRKLYYGGIMTGNKPPRMYGGNNSCPDKNEKNHLVNCPHCDLDQWANEMGFSGMTHEQMIEYIGGGKRLKPVIAEKPGYFARKALARAYKKSQKKPEKEKKVEP